MPAASSITERRSSGRESKIAASCPWETMTCCWRPTPESESNSWISSNRHETPLIAYSLSPVRNRVRVIVTSENSIGRVPDALSMVRLTSARPSAAFFDVPAKITSSILFERIVFAPCAPSTHATASTILDFPDPFGPTTTVIPGSRSSVVDSAKDLKPFKVSVLRYTAPESLPQSNLGKSLRISLHVRWITAPGGIPR